jgi:endonuclease/exonuclease/phosphatase family metal-dependent hydrolase
MRFPKTFSLLQWNIWFKEDIHNVVQFLKDNPTDIICLQELTKNHPVQSGLDTPAFIAEQLGYNYYHKEIPLRDYDGKTILIANGIFSRFPITDSHFVWINETTGGGGYDDEYRAYVEVTLDVDDKPLHVGTTHMSYTHAFEPTPNKKQETDRLVKELRKHDRNFIFTGDLNAAPDSYTIKAVSSVLQSAGPEFSEKTWTTKPFSYNGFEETELKWRLDYMFTTPDIKVVSSTLLTTDYSDHLPVRVEFEI